MGASDGLTDVGREVLGLSLLGLTDVGDEVVGSLLGIAVAKCSSPFRCWSRHAA